jgi:ribosomal protein L7/L12
MSKNNHREAIGLLFSGKSMKPVLIKIAQIAPAVFIRAFRECYPAATPKFDAVITKAENDARILAVARTHKIGAIKLHREIYKTDLKDARDAVLKLMADNGV